MQFIFSPLITSQNLKINLVINKLIRQYIPKKSNFDKFDSDFVKQVQHKINRRPSKILNFNTPKTEFFKCVAFACWIYGSFFITWKIIKAKKCFINVDFTRNEVVMYNGVLIKLDTRYIIKNKEDYLLVWISN